METSCNFIKFKNNRPFKWFCLIGKKLGCTHLNSILVDHNEDNVGLVNYLWGGLSSASKYRTKYDTP